MIAISYACGNFKYGGYVVMSVISYADKLHLYAFLPLIRYITVGTTLHVPLFFNIEEFRIFGHISRKTKKYISIQYFQISERSLLLRRLRPF
jgi:hypothetical protein